MATPNRINGMDDYAAWTATTALYPGAGTGSAEAIVYLIVGLAAELAERDVCELMHERTDELGDVLWYCARLCVENGVSLDTVWVENAEYANLANPIRPHRLAEANALGAVQKYLRGKKGVDVSHFGMQYVAETLRRLWHNDRERIAKAMEINRAKLTQRLEDGKIVRAPGE